MGRELIKPEKKAGRPKGSRTALTAKVIDDILRHWKKNGANALDEMFDKDPSSYVRTIASLIPVTVLEIESSPVCGGSISDQAGEVAEESSGIDSNE